MIRSPVEAARWWQENVGQIAPVGHCLRRFLADRWTRFHSLPGAKRYAETPAESAEVVRRHIAVADQLFAAGDEIFIFCSQLLQSETHAKAVQHLPGALLSGALVSLPAIPASVSAQDDDLYSVQATVCSWRPQSFDELVRAVADETLWGICLVSTASGNVYCPYDGGMDVFPALSQQHELQTKFADWRSPRDDGL